MAVAFILEFPGGTLDQYDAVLEKMQLNGRLPEGALFHAAGADDNGLRVCDVWEAEAIFRRFAEGKIIPTVAEVGLPMPQTRSFEATQVRGARTGTVGFVQIVSIPGGDAEIFRALDEQVLGPGGELPEGCAFHVNGALGEGYTVLDYWASRAARDAFMESKVGPAVAALGIDAEPVIEELDVHNALTQRATANV